MTGIITSHLLTTEMVVFVLMIICLVLAVFTLRPQTLKAFALAVLQTILLSSFFLVPFWDYFLTVRVRINDTMDDIESAMIQNDGLRISEFFAFFRDPFSGSLSHHLNHKMLLSPCLVLMLALIAGIYLIVRDGAKKKAQLMLYIGFSLITLFMATSIFPWNVISLQPGLGNMLAQIQFPWRYVGISTILLTLVLGSVLRSIIGSDQEKGMKYLKIIAAAA